MAVTNDGDHTSASQAEVFNSTPTRKAKTFTGADDTDAAYAYSGGTAYTCANVDCHAQMGAAAEGSDGIATPSWYSAPTYATATNVAPTTMNCAACHNNVTADTRHTVHTQAATAFGIAVTCARCHEAQTSWGPPACRRRTWARRPRT